MKATIWHNPRCSKSRAALAILEQTPGIDVEVVEYLKTPPTQDAIAALLSDAGIAPRDALRTGEAIIQDLGLDISSDAAILRAMAGHPILIERPIIRTTKGVVIARPPEKVRDIL